MSNSKNKRSPESPRIVDASEICEELGICDRTLINWIEQGRFPPPLRFSIRRRIWLRTKLDKFYEESQPELEKAKV